MADKKQCCCSCRFWELKDRDMLCRRRAPTRDLMCRPMWPNTLPLQWCGEYESADRPEVDKRKSLLRPQVKSALCEDIEIDL